MRPLPITQIRPAGWLREFLHTQQLGLTGHLEVAGRPFGTIGWGRPDANNDANVVWEPYEQDGYWLDGMIRCGLLLEDPWLTDKARARIDRVVADAEDADGYLGPAALRDLAGEDVTWPYARRRRWAHSVFFRALMADADDDQRRDRFARVLERHYLSTDYPHVEQREVCNVEAMLWVYERTGNAALLEKAVTAFGAFNERFGDEPTSVASLCSSAKPCGHGVTFHEMAKLGALLYAHTGREDWLEASINAYRKLDEHQMLVSGVVSSSEHLAGKDPLDSYEICDIADQTWSQGYLLMITGDPAYGDAIERACFNAAPGAVTPDFKALQYFSCPNQVIATATSNHNEQFIGRKHMSYRPRPGTPCCPGNVHRIMPNYAARMWMRHADDGIVAALYGPSLLTTTVGESEMQVTLRQETQYPFEEQVTFHVDLARPVTFALHLRLPGWCDAPSVEVNGETVATNGRTGWARIERQWQGGDVVRLNLPMTLKLTRWSAGGVSLERGPIVFSLPVPTRWERDRDDPQSNDAFPAWNAYPSGPWNFALDVQEISLKDDVVVEQTEAATSWWTGEQPPVRLRVPVRPVEDWSLRCATTLVDKNRSADDHRLSTVVREGDFAFTPPLPDPATLSKRFGPQQWVDLVPFGCTRLRMTIFPDADEQRP